MAEVGAAQMVLGALTARAAAVKLDIDWDLVSSYAGLLSLATFCVYIGAYGSLSKKKSSARKSGATTDEEIDEDEDDDEDLFERMTSEDAWLLPIVGSLALGGFYLTVVYLGDYWINLVLRLYFSAAGIGTVWKSSIALTRYLVGEARWKNYDQIKLTVKKGSHVIVALSSRTPSMALLPLALVPSGLYVFWKEGGRSVFLADVLAVSFAHNAISMIRLDSFRTGIILLAGLFVYDVWWVFGTEVMVKVATTLDVPIKLLWPKSMLFGSQRGYTMLGLGDIVIPGTFVGLALRYDYHRCRKSQDMKRRFFYASLGGYVVGLIATMMVMHVIGAAQPALLYLSPACILSFVMTGIMEGVLSDGWKWTDG